MSAVCGAFCLEVLLVYVHMYVRACLYVVLDNGQSSDIFQCLSGQTQFDLTHLLYVIINEKVSIVI